MNFNSLADGIYKISYRVVTIYYYCYGADLDSSYYYCCFLFFALSFPGIIVFNHTIINSGAGIHAPEIVK